MYQQMIRESLAGIGKIGTDPRHVEAWMRLEHSTLDGLDRTQFRSEVIAAVECIETDSRASERLALSFGL